MRATMTTNRIMIIKQTKMKKLLLFLLGVLAAVSVDGAEFGSNIEQCPVRYMVTSGEVVSRATPAARGRAVRTLNGGDIIYVDTEERIAVDGMQWVKVSGYEEYVLVRMLTIEDNPHYVHTAPVNKKKERSLVRFGFYDLPVWLAWTLLSVWILLALALCILISEFEFLPLFAGGYKMPNLHKFDPSFKDRKDSPESRHPIYGYGMRKILFFNHNPYVFFLEIALAFIISFAVTILLFLLIGGLVWLVCWIGRILLVALYWIVVGGGYAGVGILILVALFGGGTGGERILEIIGAGVLLLVAVTVADLKEVMYSAGMTVVEWGNQVFGVFNIFQLSLYIIKTYWFTALLIAMAPLVLFLGIAGVFFLFAYALIAIEGIIMKRYNVEHPCPTCGRPSEPAVYLSHGVPLPVDLRPGVWGLFHITHPATGEKMPTLFLNGKDRLERRCISCNNLISAKIGAEKHVAFVGVAQSGKSTLLYRVISEMLRKKIGNTPVCSFTDDLGMDETEVKNFISSISNGEKMEFFPSKTSEDRHKSVQLLVNNPKSLLPYRMYINDVAGEMFSVEGCRPEDAAFLLNTELVIMVLDPFTLSTAELELSSRMKKWYSEHSEEVQYVPVKQDLTEAVNSLENMLLHYRGSKEASKISLMLTFVKTDTGYLDGVNVNDAEALAAFAEADLGLGNVIHKLKMLFNDVSFHAISAAESANVSNIGVYVDDIFDRVDISFKRVTADNLVQNSLKLKKSDNKRTEEDRRFSSFKLKKPNMNSDVATVPIIIGFALAIVALVVYSTLNQKIRKNNFEEVMVNVEQIMSVPTAFQEALDYIDDAMAETNLSQAHLTELAAKASSIQTARTRYIDGILSVLYANLKSSGGKSNVEVSARYGALDNLRDIKAKIEELDLMIPDDQEFVGYKEKFNSIIKRYGIKL